MKGYIWTIWDCNSQVFEFAVFKLAIDCLIKNSLLYSSSVSFSLSLCFTHDVISSSLPLTLCHSLTQETLVSFLEKGAECMETAQRFEVLGDIYKLVVPIYEKLRNFQVHTADIIVIQLINWGLDIIMLSRVEI